MSSVIFPLQNTAAAITSYFGTRTAPIAGATTNHQGIDISTAAGTAVLAATSGTVTATGYNSSAGNYVYINDGNGLTTIYKHLQQILVSKGQTVAQGATIAKSGNTGTSTGAHLHFETVLNGVEVNPLSLINGSETEKTNDTETNISKWVLLLGGAVLLAIILK